MTTPPANDVSMQPNTINESCVILFYKYLTPTDSEASYLLHQFPEFYLDKLAVFQKDLCQRLGLKGRILLASEGINGTLSGISSEQLQEYKENMEQFDLTQYCGIPPAAQNSSDNFDQNDCENGKNHNIGANIFAGIDWKESRLQTHDWSASSTETILEPFPDLKISVGKELVSSGGAVSVGDIAQYGGIHLTPEEFHQKLSGNDNDQKEVVVIDVRNTFEHDIGHFINPLNQQPAMNPEMVTFSSFDPTFCQQHAPSLKDKTVLMYCTGGIRCEKASVMLKKRGVDNVYQLNGGIHRYLETFGDIGFFKGRNFVFDQRVALTPSEQYHQRKQPLDNQADMDHNFDKNDNASGRHVVVGKCVECQTPYDEISGSRLCTVCRDLVLVCPTCQAELREYHCRRHQKWRECYFTFLEVFDESQLQHQKDLLEQLLQQEHSSKRIRQTIRRQVEKVQKRLEEVRANPSIVNCEAPRRCRSCMEPSTVCNGLCWGFWKAASAASRQQLR